MDTYALCGELPTEVLRSARSAASTRPTVRIGATSGEAVAIDVQPISFFLRVLGAAIDVLLSVGVFIAFLADRMLPSARSRVAGDLLAEARPCISPLPDAPDETVLVAATVLRRERETRALEIADARAELLTRVRIRV